MKTNSWTPVGQATEKKKKKKKKNPVPTGVQLKREAKLLTVIGLNTKHADCHIIYMLYPIRL